MVFGSRREKVDVSGGPQFLFGPYPEESRTLQGESIHLAGVARRYRKRSIA